MLSEIQASPEGDEPEWIELERTSSDLEPGEWAIVDGSENRAMFVPPEGTGEFLLVTADRAALLGVHPLVDPNIVIEVNLPTLNDREERIFLLSPGQAISDEVAIETAPASGTLERVNLMLPSSDSAAWVVSPHGATPGAVNGAHARPKPTEGLAVIPRVVRAGGCEIQLNVGGGSGDLEIVVSDVNGRIRGVVLSRPGASGRTGLHWDGRIGGIPLGKGLYVLVARFYTGDGVRILRTSVAIAGDPS
jgi:hypothetical protein